MPGTLLHMGAIVQCQHQAIATPTISYPRVKVSGQFIVLQPTPYTVNGCSFKPLPCATAQWLTAATRIKANKLPVLLRDSTATCLPTGTPLKVVNTQPRVKGQ